MNAHAATRRAVLAALPAMAYIDPWGLAIAAVYPIPSMRPCIATARPMTF